MFHFYQVVVLLLTIASQVHMETKDVKCEDPKKFCENIWNCKRNSYPDKYEPCGHDGSVDKVCCEPDYPPTKSRKYCDTLYTKIARDEYGHQVFNFTTPKTSYSAGLAALGYRNESSTDWVCAGSLISNKFVITAASCLNQKINIVCLGDRDLKKNDDGVEPQEYGVLKHFVHPKYHAPFVYNDIAIIELNDTVKFTKFVKPYCVYDDALIREPLWDEVGYKGLAYASTQVVELNSRACNLYFDTLKFADLVPFGLDPQTQFCASSPMHHFTCQSYVGAPMQTFDLNYVSGQFLLGVTAIPKPCSKTNEPGIYTKLSNYAAWIESIVFSDANSSYIQN